MNMRTQDEGPVLQQKLCIAALMDQHPDLFVRTVPERSWKAFVEAGISPTGQDRRSVDKALGMIGALFRSAQMALGDLPTPGQIFAADKSGLAEQLVPDPLTLEMIGADALEDPESLALARSVSLYKKAASAGILDPEQLGLHIDAALDEQPEHTALARDIKVAARRIAALEMGRLLRDISGPAQ
jgi:hypothetical protein